MNFPPLNVATPAPSRVIVEMADLMAATGHLNVAGALCLRANRADLAERIGALMVEVSDASGAMEPQAFGLAS